MVVCPGKNLMSGVTEGWAYVEHILNLLDTSDPENKKMFEFIPKRILQQRIDANQFFSDVV